MNSPFFNRCLEKQYTYVLQMPANHFLAVVLHPGYPKSGKKISHFLGNKFPNPRGFSSACTSRLWISYQYQVNRAGMTFACSKRIEIRTIIENFHFMPSLSPSSTMTHKNKFTLSLRIRLLCNYLAKKCHCGEASRLENYCF